MRRKLKPQLPVRRVYNVDAGGFLRCSIEVSQFDMFGKKLEGEGARIYLNPHSGPGRYIFYDNILEAFAAADNLYATLSGVSRSAHDNLLEEFYTRSKKPKGEIKG